MIHHFKLFKVFKLSNFFKLCILFPPSKKMLGIWARILMLVIYEGRYWEIYKSFFNGSLHLYPKSYCSSLTDVFKALLLILNWIPFMLVHNAMETMCWTKMNIFKTYNSFVNNIMSYYVLFWSKTDETSLTTVHIQLHIRQHHNRIIAITILPFIL